MALPPTAKEDSISTIKGTARNANEDFQSSANQAGRKLRTVFNAASYEIAHAGDTVTAEIRTHPLRSSAIALGVGVVLGALLRR